MPTIGCRPARFASALAIVACIIAPASVPAQQGQRTTKTAKPQPNFYTGPAKVTAETRQGQKPIGAGTSTQSNAAASIDPKAPKYTSAYRLGFEKPQMALTPAQNSRQPAHQATAPADSAQRQTHRPGQVFYQNASGASAQTQARTPTRQRAAQPVQVQTVSNQRGLGRLFQTHQQQSQRAVEAPRYQSAGGLEQRGQASWYGKGFHGGKTANGETYDMNSMTAAHRTLPFGTMVKVTNLHNGAETVVRVNNRGPFHGNRIIDLSKGAAARLGMVNRGVAQVRLEIVKLATGR